MSESTPQPDSIPTTVEKIIKGLAVEAGVSLGKDGTKLLIETVQRGYEVALMDERREELIRATLELRRRLLDAARMYNSEPENTFKNSGPSDPAFEGAPDVQFLSYAMAGICPLWPFC